MSNSKKIFHGTMVLTAGQIGGYGLSFGRNIILARMLSKSDFGLAAIFGITILLLEIAGRMSFGQQIIQSRDGDSPAFQGTSHAFQFCLSAGGALLIFGSSGMMARAFNLPGQAWAFAALAAVPLAKGFEHLDYYRRQRALDYYPAVFCEVIPQAAMTAAAWPMAMWLGDFRVFVWLMIGKAVAGILMTHLLAQRAYHWEWNRDYVRGMWVFGWPLFLNGLLMFASQQADQVLVGSFLTLDDLAHYALALSLVSIPWYIFGQVASSLLLPILSSVQGDLILFREKYRASVEYAAVGAVALTLPLIIGGEQLVSLLYGRKYSGTGAVMGVLGAACTIRFLRFVPALAAMARGDTLNQLYSNLYRGLSLPLAAFAAWTGAGMIQIASCALFAEIVTTVGSVLRLRKHQGVPLGDTVGAAAYVGCFLAVGLILIVIGVRQWDFWLAAVAMLAMILMSIGIGFLVFPAFARTVREIYRDKLAPSVQQLV